MTLPCKICGKPTQYTGTGLCDPCWNTTYQVENNPNLAKIMYHISPLRPAFETANGVQCAIWQSAAKQTAAIMVVVWAFASDVPIEARYRQQDTWELCHGCPVDFLNYCYRRAQPDDNDDDAAAGMSFAATGALLDVVT